MTSTSFNPVQMQTQQTQLNQPLTLREGQVFHGTIKQLFPDQMAEVQVGNHKLIAKTHIRTTDEIYSCPKNIEGSPYTLGKSRWLDNKLFLEVSH